MNSLIKISNLSKSFGDQKKIKVLKKISFNFKKGKIYSLMGPSGSGKTTLLNLLSLIDRPNSGSIIIQKNKINFKEKNKNDFLRAKKIGIIYQQDNLLNDFTALENIYLSGLAVGESKKYSIDRAKYLLKKFKIFNRSSHYPYQLSGGEKQRVSIARAIINNPEIILADEPTGSLDFETARKVFQLLRDQLNPNRIIIFATHNRFFAKKSDYLLEIVNGSIKTVND